MAVHAVLAEHGAYRIPEEVFVWYGDADGTDGADALGRRGPDLNIPLLVKVSSLSPSGAGDLPADRATSLRPPFGVS
jgi:hypothetical protein